MKTKIFRSYLDFLHREDLTINGVSHKFAKKHPNYIEDNMTNIGCWNCYKCIGCRYSKNCINIKFGSWLSQQRNAWRKSEISVLTVVLIGVMYLLRKPLAWSQKNE